MNKHEASQLLDEMEAADYRGQLYRLGNSEYVVAINGLFLWGKADWKQYKKGKLPALLVRKEREEASA